MKHFRLLKNISLSAIALATAAFLGSCASSSPIEKSEQLKHSVAASVFSYNDTCSPKVRDCVEAGALPDRAKRALVTWLHESTPKSFSYTYPQYYLSVQDKKGHTDVWALCSDCQGNLVGILIPRRGIPAWDIPYPSEHIVYVCDAPERKDLSKAIMDSLAEAGYDKYRLDTRRACGLTQDRYLISKPLTDDQQKRLEKLREAEKAAAAAQASGKPAQETSDSGADDFSFDSDDSSDDDDDKEEKKDDSDSDSDDSGDDGGDDDE